MTFGQGIPGCHGRAKTACVAGSITVCTRLSDYPPTISSNDVAPDVSTPAPEDQTGCCWTLRQVSQWAGRRGLVAGMLRAEDP